MRLASICVAAFITMIFLVSPHALAQNDKRNKLAGWWGYDKECPASDDGFGLNKDGRASDGNGTYEGRWSLSKDQITIVWNAVKSERTHIKRSEWRVVENFKLVRTPQQRDMLVNIKDNTQAWLCRNY